MKKTFLSTICSLTQKNFTKMQLIQIPVTLFYKCILHFLRKLFIISLLSVGGFLFLFLLKSVWNPSKICNEKVMVCRGPVLAHLRRHWPSAPNQHQNTNYLINKILKFLFTVILFFAFVYMFFCAPIRLFASTVILRLPLTALTIGISRNIRHA